MMYTLREKLAYSAIGKFLAKRITAGTNYRAHWLQQRWADGFFGTGA